MKVGKTSIEWATDTWNPITGCTPVSPGCDHCYARRMAKRLAGRFGYPESPKEFDVTFHSDRLEDPLHWWKPRVVFVSSMGDLFHEDVADEQLAAIFNMMQTCNNHIFLLLTKRPQRMGAFWKLWFDAYDGLFKLSATTALPNVYLGVTVETQDQMWRVEKLLEIPAAKRFVSFEPLLGPIGVEQREIVRYPLWLIDQLDGVIVGGESGPGARPMHPDWVRGIRDQCVQAGVPFTFKQWGEWAPEEAISENDRIVAGAHDRWGTVDLDGRLWELTTPWTSIDLQTGEMTKDPEEAVMWRVGKKAAGRELDGQVWDQWPWDMISEI